MESMNSAASRCRKRRRERQAEALEPNLQKDE